MSHWLAVYHHTANSFLVHLTAITAVVAAVDAVAAVAAVADVLLASCVRYLENKTKDTSKIRQFPCKGGGGRLWGNRKFVNRHRIFRNFLKNKKQERKKLITFFKLNAFHFKANIFC